MKKAFGVIGTIVVAILIVAILVGPAGGNKVLASQPVASPVIDTGDNISSMEAPEWTRAAKEWTAAEMASARPYPLAEPTVSRNVSAVAAADGNTVEPLQGQQLQTFAPGVAEGDQPFAAGAAADVFFSPAAAGGYSYPAPFTRFTRIVKYSKEYPYKSVGKLFFTQYGVNYVCSAASIGNKAIWTAGHCVHAGDNSNTGWSYNVVFVPAYFNGKGIGGTWRAQNLWVKSDWYTSADLGKDMGGAVLELRGGKKVSQKAGWLGFAYVPSSYGYMPIAHWFAMGYPAAYPFDGLKQVICAGSYAYSDTTFTPAPHAIGCDQTGGTSGGPWVLAFGNGSYLNGNMSYRYPGYPYELFSPYFDDAAYSLWYALINS